MITCLSCRSVPAREFRFSGRGELKCDCGRLSVRLDRTDFRSLTRRAIVFSEGFRPVPLEDVLSDVLAEDVLDS